MLIRESAVGMVGSFTLRTSSAKDRLVVHLFGHVDRIASIDNRRPEVEIFLGRRVGEPLVHLDRKVVDVKVVLLPAGKPDQVEGLLVRIEGRERDLNRAFAGFDSAFRLRTTFQDAFKYLAAGIGLCEVQVDTFPELRRRSKVLSQDDLPVLCGSLDSWSATCAHG